MLMRTLVSLLVILITSVTAEAEQYTPQMAIQAENNGDHKRAIKIFSELANNGDSKAMIHIGNKYYNGYGVTTDYKKAMDWWLKAFESNNGDAPGNIGVLFRDGKGVAKNRKIAYVLFLFTHMAGLGTDSTQIRVNNHLRKEVAELSQESIREALCYTGAYVFKYVRARGKLKEIPESVLPKNGAVRIKDNNWWLESERKRLQFPCPSPWD